MLELLILENWDEKRGVSSPEPAAHRNTVADVVIVFSVVGFR